jgi:hypothetical protein
MSWAGCKAGETECEVKVATFVVRKLQVKRILYPKFLKDIIFK